MRMEAHGILSRWYTHLVRLGQNPDVEILFVYVLYLCMCKCVLCVFCACVLERR